MYAFNVLLILCKYAYVVTATIFGE